MTRLVLTNAVYFKGDWVQPFDKKNTHDEDFAVSAQEKVKAPLMHQQTQDGLRGGGDLPGCWRCPTPGETCRWSCSCRKRWTDCPTWRRRSPPTSSASLIPKLRVREVNISLPKFKLETSFGLNPTLEAMGMKRAFSREADFSGISSAEALCISDVIHKAYVDVNEEGTEAAAATAVVMRAMAARRPAGSGIPGRSPLPVLDP